MKITDLLESEFLTDRDKIIKWMKKSFLLFDPSKLNIDSDGLAYDGYLDLERSIDKLQFQFKEITGAFDCNFSKITSLEGCPRIVGLGFSCTGTNITSLKYCPQSIGTTFWCHTTKITNPKEYRFVLYCEIGGEFNSGNKEMDNIINTYSGSANRKHWPHAINLLSKVRL